MQNTAASFFSIIINIIADIISVTASGTGSVGNSYSLECAVTLSLMDLPSITWFDPKNRTITSGVVTTGSMIYTDIKLLIQW